MKIESFAVTSNGDSGVNNQENYFLNGIYKEDILSEESYDTNVSFGKRDMFAVSDGSKSAASGEEAAFLSVDMLRDFLGSEFKFTNESYFAEVNNKVAGKIFENDGKNARLDMAVLYINRHEATVYNIGESAVFFFDGETVRKITGNVPETVEIEETAVDEFGNVIIETVEMKTAKFLGEDPEMYAIRPYASNRIKINAKSAFLLCTNQVAETVSEETLIDILKNKKKNIDEKVSEIMGRALDANPQSGATAVLVDVKKSLDFSWMRSKKFILIMLLIIASLIGIAFNDVIYKGLRSFVYEYVWDDRVVESVEVDPWVPQPYNPYERKYEEASESPETKPETPAANETDNASDEQPAVTQSPQPAPSQPSQPVSKPKNIAPTVIPATQPIVETPAVQPETQPSQIPEPPVAKPPVESQEPQVKTNDAELPIDFN